MYNDYNDHELLYMICESSEDAMDIMYEKYKSIIVVDYITYSYRINSCFCCKLAI